MRLTRTLPLLAALALPLTGCFDRQGKRGGCGEDEPMPSSVTDLTRGEWFLIGSANNATAEVFRPQAEPRRGQFKYTFASNGGYTSDLSDCTPAGVSIVGTWTLKNQTLTLHPTGRPVEVKQIVSISPTELQLAR